MRSAHDVTGLWVRLFPRFARSATTLQGQVKALMVHSILSGKVPADARVPPSRSLALALGVSRNTVALALQTLVDKGFLVARSRSGLFVNREILAGQVPVGAGVGEGDAGGSAGANGERSPPDLHWATRLKSRLREQRNIDKPANWQEFRYPFIYGQFDASLMPLKDWRACTRQSLLAPAVRNWSQDFMDRDSEVLLEQIQHRLLPARGIFAAREEILVTAGAQMACHLLAQVLVSRSTVVGIEDPGYPDARNNFALRSANVRLLPVDAQGLVVGRALAACAYAFVTPSHQCPSTVTMPMPRRHQLLELARKRDMVLFEDDHESELNFSGKPLPALKSLDTDGRVVYIGSLSKTLAHGLRIGFIVAPAELVRELRALRRLVMRHAATNNAHVAGLFIAQGHHDAFIRRLNVTYRERRQCLVDAFDRHLPGFRISPSAGGSAAWVQGPAGLDSQLLAAQCQRRGVLIEPGAIFFGEPAAKRQAFFRLGYSAIPAPLIDAGVRELRQACRELGLG